MFWRFGGYANISTIDTILDKPDVTVEELLDESDLIQELKQNNAKLIDYLRDENVVERLLRYVVAPKPAPSPDDDATAPEKPRARRTSMDAAREGFFGRVRGKSRSQSISKQDEEESKEEKQRMKYAYMATEILSSDVWSITEALLENPEALRAFWLYIKHPAPLDPVQAGYFTKVNEALFDRKTEDMLNFFKTMDNVVPDMLSHVDCPMIMDLLLKIISLEKNEGGQGIIDWLQTKDLIPILLSYLSPDHSSATQTSAGDFLKAIITISANATTQDQSVIGPNELTRQLVSEPCVKTLVEDMLRGGNPLTVGVGIIIEVIRKNNSDYDLENQIGPVPRSSDPIYLGTLLREFAKHVSEFMDLVNNPNHTLTNSDGTTVTRKRELNAAFGKKIEPLGFDRFKTCELMAELLHCSNMALLNERGSEAEVKRRDEERDRLKAEGKLQARENEASNEYGTSVDSHGFHHAEPPSPTDDQPEEVKRSEVRESLEEDEFEKVAASEAVQDEVKDDFDEKEEIGEPLTRSPKVHPQMRHLERTESLDEPLPPAESDTKEEEEGESTPKADAESPTSAGLTAKVGGLDLDNDTVMSNESHESPATEETEVKTEDKQPKDVQHLQTPEREPQGMSPHPDDKPAPLFSGKTDKLTANTDATSAVNDAAGDSEVTPIEDVEDSHSVLLAGQEGDASSPYEVDLDGSPVVGDLLKIQFVQHKVVPTILDFFFRFPWNNFLHNVVYDVVQQVFNGHMDRGYNRSLAIDLFETGRVTERIIEGQKASDKSQAETNMRLGYMGHLTLIAEEVVKFTERHPAELLSQTVLDKVMGQAWIDYVEQTLAETRERDNAILGGVRPDMALGPRQAVLNAVNAASNFNNNGSSLASTGLSNSGTVGLDSMDLTNASNASGGAYGLSGGSLLSGFNNSSDEEDEEMDEGDESRQSTLPPPSSAVDDDDQAGTTSHPAPPPSSSALPQPLQVPPSRARRQFAARLAQRKQAMERDQAGTSSSNTASDEGMIDLDAPSHEDDLANLDTPQRAEFEQLQEQEQEDRAAEALRTEEGSGLSGWGVSAEPAAYDEGIAIRRGPERFSELFGSLDSDSDEEDGVEMKAKSGSGQGHGGGGGEGKD